MTGGVIAVGGWAAAALGAAVMLLVWRVLMGRMEAVARACHELRGPLTAARLGLQLGVRMGELSRTRLRAIELELGRASLALDDLACVRDGGRPARTVGEIDVPDLLTDSVEAWQAAAAAAGVGLVARWSGARAQVVGDRLRLAQATGNLIANAIEHGGGLVEVRGRADSGAVEIEVTDRGPGLPAPVLQLTRAAHRGRGSRGRGLAITAAIAASHGGRLAAAPSERGARLVLELPRQPAG